jgi:hypothetical protein
VCNPGRWWRSPSVGRMVCCLARGLLALAPAALPACYHYIPLQSSPAPGIEIQVELNDLGRVGMAEAVGPGVRKIEGLLESSADSGSVIRVARVEGEDGVVTRWEGERVAIKAQYIRTVRERRFSAGRTAIAAAIVTAGATAFVFTRDLLGSGNSPSHGPGDTGAGGGQ